MENKISSLKNQAEDCFNLANHYVEEEKFDLAIKKLTQAIQLNPDYAEAYFSRGNCYFLGDYTNYTSALHDYTEAIRLDFSNPYFYGRRASCYQKQEDYKSALNDYNKAIQLDSSNSYIYSHRASCYQEQKDYKSALIDYNEAIRLNPDDAYLYIRRASCYQEQKDYESALSDYNEAIRLNPDDVKLYSDLSRMNENSKTDLSNYINLIELNDDSGKFYNYFEKRKEICFLISNTSIIEKNYQKARYYIEKAFESLDGNYLLEELRHKQVYLNGIDNIEELDRKNQELEQKNQRLELEIKKKESLENRMQKLVEQFTHSLGNVIFPDTIYQVAERWKNNPECRKDVLLLHEAYHSEITIKLQGELLRQRHTNTDPEKFRNLIRSCRRLPNNSDNTKSIEDILDYAASRVTARFLNQHYAGLNTIRDKILAKKGVDINALKQKFEDDILLNKSLRPIAWINENLRPVQITEISPLWKKVCILAESHAEALLFGYFSEILFNAFKYANHDKDEFLTLVFNESVINDKTYLACSWKNPVKDKTPLLGTGKGLDAIQEDLKQLNDTENPEQSLLVQQQNNQFQVTLFFNKDLLIDDLPILTRKRKTIEANHA